MPNIPILFSTLFLLCSVSLAHAQDEKLDVPRFVTLKSQEVNARTGPSLRYPIRWTYLKKGEPVEIVSEFELWRLIRDRYGDEGWVHKSMLVGKRAVVIIGDQNQLLKRKPEENAPAVVELEPEVRADLESCKGDWCQISVSSYTGWINRHTLWGVYPNEQLQ